MSSNMSVSNKSYTNKDFNSIYVELLEYAKKWSYKWDPTASDESDPGVVLLKLAAIIGDKDNYNIDKNILELMPSSVTQLPAARQLFEQCGYSMHYYQAATGSLKLSLNKELDVAEDDSTEYFYTVPQFTMFTDIDSSIVYTTVEPANLTVGQDTLVEIIEGTVSDYSVNNDQLITLSNLDSKNRIYFTESDVAENGIFITNVDVNNEPKNNYDDWYRVDNLEIQKKGKPCYKFGVNIDASMCYLEFPDDVETLIGQGINIKYIRTSGKTGSVSTNQINKLYVDTKLTRKAVADSTDITEVTVTTDDLTITNPQAIINGKDPQSIDDAFKTYTKVKDTFDTLVSLRDYNNHMVLNHASNGYVCDRTNDIQHSYKVLEASRTVNYLTTIVESKEVTYVDKTNSSISATVDQPTMQPFDLCIYALEYVPSVVDSSTYEKTFNLTDGSNYAKYLNSEEVNSIQHNFIEFDTERILMVKNKYSLRCTVLPTEKLTPTESFQIKSKLETALYEALNSKQLTFGNTIDPVGIKNVMLSCDDRIKDIENSFSTTPFETYVVYKAKDGTMKEMRVDMNSFSGGYSQITNMSKAKFTSMNDGKSLFFEKSGELISVKSSDTYDKEIVYYTYSDDDNRLWNEFRTEIFAKNILAGVTPLYDRDSTFMFGLNQDKVANYENVIKISTNTELEFSSDSTGTTFTSPKIEQNESILLKAPNYIEENSYASYVKIIYSLKDNTDILSANTKYTLTDDDFIIFFWKATETDEYYTYVKYDKNTPANVISPSFTFDTSTNKDIYTPTVLNHFRNLPSGKHETNSSVKIKDLNNQSVTQFVESLKSEKLNQVLVGQNIIKTLKVNTIQINENSEKGSTHIYWVLNTDDSSDVYRLFDKNTNEYTLGSGEYFIYTNTSKTTLYLLGEGTVLKRTDWSLNDLVWEVKKVDTTKLFTEGISVLNNYWKKIPLSDTAKLTATEMQQHLIGPGYQLKLTVEDIDLVDKTNENIVLEKETSGEGEFAVTQYKVTSIKLNSTLTSLAGFDIRYTDGSQIYKVDYISDANNSWRGISILNIVTSSEVPQKLGPNQEFILYTEGSTSSEPIKGDDESSVMVLANSVINTLGGSNVELNKSTDIELLCYTPVKNITYQSDNGVVSLSYSEDSPNVDISLSATTNDENKYTWEFSLQKFTALAGTYLLHVVTGTDITELKIKKSNIEDNDYTIEALLDDKLAVHNIYKLHVEDVEEGYNTINLDVIVSANTNNADLTIQPLYKYRNKTLRDIECEDKDGNTFEQLLLKKLDELDVNKSFDYTSTDTANITNPLEANSFLDSAHVYNPFTICQWYQKDTVNGDIVVRLNIV